MKVWVALIGVSLFTAAHAAEHPHTKLILKIVEASKSGDVKSFLVTLPKAAIGLTDYTGEIKPPATIAPKDVWRLTQQCDIASFQVVEYRDIDSLNSNVTWYCTGQSLPKNKCSMPIYTLSFLEQNFVGFAQYQGRNYKACPPKPTDLAPPPIVRAN